VRSFSLLEPVLKKSKFLLQQYTLPLIMSWVNHTVNYTQYVKIFCC